MNFKYKIKHFKELSLEELYEICKLRYEVFVCDQEITCENDFDDKDKDCYHLMVYLEDKMVAYCRILKAGISYDAPSIGRVLVLKEHRRKNIAKLMMEKAIEFITSNLGDEIKLSAQLYVKELYKSLGFEEISEIYEEASIPHVKMKYKK